MPVSLFYGLWGAGVVLKATAASRMVWNGLGKRYFLVWIFLLASSVRSVSLIVLRPHSVAYGQFYFASLPLVLMSECFAIASVFWIITENYMRFRRIGAGLLAVLAMFGAGCAWITCFVVFPSAMDSLRETALLVQRYVSIVLALLVLGTRLFLPRTPHIPIRVSAQRAADIFALDAVLGIAASSLSRLYGFSHPVIANVAPMACGIIIGLLWLVAMTPASDHDPVIRKLTPEEMEIEGRESVARLGALNTELREASRHLGGLL